MLFRKTLLTLSLTLMTTLILGSSPVAAADNQGFIYGTVTTESGKEYKGFIRWGNQEAFWDDLFHSAKEEFPFFDELDDDDLDEIRKHRRKRFSIFGKDVRVDGGGFSRMFITRFGDIEKIEPHGDGEAHVFMKTGQSYRVSGAADDVTSKIHVNDASLGEMTLHWDRIELIEFSTVPKGADPGVWRLHGRVETDEGDFEGYIQWDKQECINTDKLDGDTEDGDVSIKMGTIKSIENLSRRKSEVVLRDGRTMVLSGSNDVNHENRGIMIEDARFGRVTVDWKSFQKITFNDARGSGKGYDDYKPHGNLTGTVYDEDGDSYKGRIAFDLDEGEGWEMLNGSIEGVKFDIPFYRVKPVEPRRSVTTVILHNGQELELEDGTDIDKNNAGIIVFVKGDDPVYVRWRDVEKIEFDG